MLFAKRIIASSLLTASLGLASSGCLTQALMESNSPEALVFLPATLTFDMIALAAAGAAKGGSSSGGSTAPLPTTNYSALGWSDPDDWVADCSGPLTCPDHQHFVCRGGPGDCSCSCETTLSPKTDACVVAEPLADASCAPGQQLARR